MAIHHIVKWTAVCLSLIAPAIAQDMQANELNHYSGIMNGNIGIGLTLVHGPDKQLHGSYFYERYRKDIELKGTYTSDRDIELNEYDKSGSVRATMHLHFAETDPEFKGRELKEEVLVGSWTSGTKSYPVHLRLESITYVSDESRRYESLGVEDAQAYEREVQIFYFAVMKGNKNVAARRVRYPVHVNIGKKKIVLRSPTEFVAHWAEIFTPEYLACLKKATPHELFVNNRGAAIGRGEVWFDEKGFVVSLNSCFAPIS